MRNYSKWIIMCSVVFISLIILPTLLLATPGDGGVTDPDAPIDGGLGLLIATGVGYGYKKFRNHNKNKSVV